MSNTDTCTNFILVKDLILTNNDCLYTVMLNIFLTQYLYILQTLSLQKLIINYTIVREFIVFGFVSISVNKPRSKILNE